MMINDVVSLVFIMTCFAGPQTPEPNDLVFGLSNSSAADSLELVRGPAVENGGGAVPDFWLAPFIQSVEFDNLDFILHNPAGNLLVYYQGHMP